MAIRILLSSSIQMLISITWLDISLLAANVLIWPCWLFTINYWETFSEN